MVVPAVLVSLLLLSQASTPAPSRQDSELFDAVKLGQLAIDELLTKGAAVNTMTAMASRC